MTPPSLETELAVEFLCTYKAELSLKQELFIMAMMFFMVLLTGFGKIICFQVVSLARLVRLVSILFDYKLWL